MSSIKASEKGLARIKQAIAQSEWRVHDHRWLLAASELLEPDGDWQLDGPYAYGYSSQIWERFLRRTSIRDRSFIAFCQVLSLLSDEVTEPEHNLITEVSLPSDNFSQTVESIVSRLLPCVERHRCLIVIDSAKILFSKGNLADYVKDDEDDRNMMNWLSQVAQQSCVMVIHPKKLKGEQIV